MSWSNLTENIKALSVAAGLTTASFGIYTTIGLPVPATVAMVNARVDGVKQEFRSLTLIVLEGHREQFETRRQVLRAEKYSLERSRPSSIDARLAFESRLSQINDELKELETRDAELRHKIEDMKVKLTPAANAHQASS